MSPYENRYWSSADGVRLHYRDYPGAADRPPIVCLPGLTRNRRDFEALAQRLSPAWRVLALDLRGRGDSGYARDPMSYVPATYVRDVAALLAELGIVRYVAFGTSIGGVVAMLLAADGATTGGTPDERTVPAGVLLNDVGPEIMPEGLARIHGHIGKSNTWPTWVHAARAVAEANASVHPDYALEDWLAMAKRLYRLNGAGRIVLDYDMKIAEPFRVPGDDTGPDLWRALDALKGVPVLILRGDTSDMVSAGVARRMADTLDRAELVSVPRTGHAPTLGEAAAVAGIDRLLAKIAAEPPPA